ncbi:MAG: rhodanese-like domain-containing protein [Candidatus Competibacteraceae bacterium]|nr:rhodanese-like domain-containing protein [Candidatus Competibacteraceae bacterium]
MKNTILFLILFYSASLFAQKSIDKLLKKHNENSIPYISPQELAIPKTNLILLDSRELKEYNTSHLKNAIHVGYDHFNIDSVLKKIPIKPLNVNHNFKLDPV